jgi:hypothetical protein
MFLTYLKEALSTIKVNLTLDDVLDYLIDNDRFLNTDGRVLMSMLDDALGSGKYKEDYEKILNKYNDAINEAVAILDSKNVPYIDTSKKSFISGFVDGYRNSYEKENFSWFPVPLYVSNDKNDKNTIGILVHKDGKLEMFEGNDEATDETNTFVNEILGKSELVKIYGNHGQEVIDFIKKNNKLPAGLYVSPNKNYASGYFDLKGDRYLFSGKVDTNKFRKESDVDWKTIGEPEIKNFMVLN